MRARGWINGRLNGIGAAVELWIGESYGFQPTIHVASRAIGRSGHMCSSPMPMLVYPSGEILRPQMYHGQKVRNILTSIRFLSMGIRVNV